MPNRIIKESICTSDTIAALGAPANAEIFFYRLMVNCDDFGRMDARPAILRAKCFPLCVDEITIPEIETWLNKLVEVSLVVVYTHEGKPYLQLKTWSEHQQTRANKSKYPGPDDHGSQLLSNSSHSEPEKSVSENCNQLIADDINGNQAQANVLVFDIRNTIFDKRYTDTETNADSDEPPAPRSKTSSSPQNTLLEFVKLTDDEHQKLVKQLGQELTMQYIERLNGYIGQIGIKQAAKKYKSHYFTILNWWRKDGNPSSKSPPPTRRNSAQSEPSGLDYLRSVIEGGSGG